MRRNTMVVLTIWALAACARGEQNEGLTSTAFSSTAIGSAGDEAGTDADASSGADDGDDGAPVDPEGSSSSNGDSAAGGGLAERR